MRQRLDGTSLIEMLPFLIASPTTRSVSYGFNDPVKLKALQSKVQRQTLARSLVASSLVSLSILASDLGCSTGSDHNIRDHYPYASSSTGGAPNIAIDGDAAAEVQDLCADPASVSKPYVGVNLTGMAMQKYGWSTGYSESDFSLLHDLGVNWARLPLDYLNYTEIGDWLMYNPAGLGKIDQGVALGCQYGIHVCLNMYQAPGYSVASSPDPSGLNLWQDAAAQQTFAAHWQMFARRYANVPAENLSFNLVNEPASIDESTYVSVMQQAIRLIREVSPNRPILVDGLNFGRIPLTTLTDPTIIQSVHDYDPTQITRYKDPTLNGSTSYPAPTWPPFMANRFLFGPVHTDVAGSGPGQDYCQETSDGYCAPLTLLGNFPAGTSISIRIHQVSYSDATVANAPSTHLAVYADSSTQAVFEQDYSATSYPADGAVCNSTCGNATYHVLQPVLDQDYPFAIDADAQSVSFQMTSGDWVAISEIDIQYPANSGMAAVRLAPAIQNWNVPQTAFRLNAFGSAVLAGSPPAGYEQSFNPVGWLDAWKALKQSGIPVMVGEFGVYNLTPQDVTLAWLKDQITAFQQAGFNGWADWDPFTEFGFLGPLRPGETPEYISSRPLNRPWLDLLKQQ